MKTSKPVVSAIIPALNEGKTLANVLRAVVNHPLVLEVIVIDDGSTDNTSDIANSFGVSLIVNHNNLGKTCSCKIGTEQATGSVILYLDADLIGITADDITKLVSQVINDEVEMTMSLRGNSILRPLGIDFFTGERAIKKQLLDDPLIWSNISSIYSLEILMNQSVLNHHYRYKVIDTRDTTIIYKFKKQGFLHGMRNEIKIWGFDIPKSIGYVATIRQCFQMVALNNKY